MQQRLSQRESDLEKLRGQISEAGNARAAAEAKQGAAEKLLAEQRELQAKALTDLREAFKALSADALKQSAPEFLRLAEQSFGKFQETAKGDLAQRQEAIKGLVEPLKQQLDSYQKRLQQSETAQSSALGEVRKHLETLAQSNQTLASETAQFRPSEIKPSARQMGRGDAAARRRGGGHECALRFHGADGIGRNPADLIVKLPGDRFIIVDAKVPDFDFLNALETAEPVKRAEALAAHAAKLKGTIKALADRDYPRQFPNSLDYVVLFVPAESLFSAALEGDHDLIVWAAEKRILLATPASLIALLRSVSVSWQQHAQTENAQKIAEAAQELYSRVATFTEHFEKIRDGLNKANEAFDRAASSYQSRIRPAGERLVELGGATSAKQLADISRWIRRCACLRDEFWHDSVHAQIFRSHSRTGFSVQRIRP